MAIFLSFPETSRRAEMIRPAGACEWFEMPHGWHVCTPDLAPHLVKAVRAGKWNGGRIFYVLAAYPDGTSLRIEGGAQTLNASIDTANQMQRGANLLGNPAGTWYQVRTLVDNFPIYMTKGGRQ